MIPVFSVLFTLCSPVRRQKTMDVPSVLRSTSVAWKRRWKECPEISGSTGNTKNTGKEPNYQDVTAFPVDINNWERGNEFRIEVDRKLIQGYACESRRIHGNCLADEFIERRETGLYIAGSRLPIDRIICEYHNGEEPEAIAHHLTLSVERSL